MGECKRNEEDQARDGAGCCDVRHQHENGKDDEGGDEDGDRRRSPAPVDIAQRVGKRSISRHGERDARGGEQIRLEGGQHREHGRDDDQPEAERSHVGPGRGGYDGCRILEAQRGDRVARLDTDGGDNEEEWQVDRQGRGQ